MKLIFPSSSSWSDLTTTKQRRDQRKLFYGGDIISALMPPSRNKSLHVIMSMKMLTPKLSPSSSTEPPQRRRFHHSLHRRRRGGEGDKTQIPRNLAWRDTNPNDSIYQRKLIKNNGSPLPPAFGEMPEGKGGGPAVMEDGGCDGDGARVSASCQSNQLSYQSFLSTS